MSSFPPSRFSAHQHPTAEDRLRDALLHFPRSRFGAEERKHEAELREPPEELTVVTMLEALELVGTERVLEIGSATAYTTALLSRLAVEVYSVVPEPELAERRADELSALGCGNAHVVLAASEEGWPAAAPYQAILVGAAASEVPLELVNQLDEGGRLVISVGDADAQLLERFRKRTGALDAETLGTCHLRHPLSAFAPPSGVPWANPSRS